MGPGRAVGVLAEAALEVRPPGVRSQDVHRVAAGRAAPVPADRAAARADGRRGRRARLHCGRGGPVAVCVVAGCAPRLRAER